MYYYSGVFDMKKIKCDCCAKEFLLCEMEEDGFGCIFCEGCNKSLARQEFIDCYDDSYLDYLED